MKKMELPFRYILTVSELTRDVKDLLESQFPEVWVEGEISNLRIPSSGHLYFTLKDDLSQIRGVFFKGQAKSLRFTPEDGLHVICRARLSVYEKRGEYQLILDFMEPKGIGALQLAFLQLKERLEKEGLFDPIHKKTIPMVPRTVGIITSPTGAVIRDILHILRRRFENLPVFIYPVRVQGEGAPREIAEAIAYFNEQKNVDVIIVGRGGGSLEDLWAFNEEEVARAIYASKIPIVSAVGHETDYTISDFVADLRAPTPSAAAELVVTSKTEIKNFLHHWTDRLESQILRILEEYRLELHHFKRTLVNPKRRIEDSFFRVDDLSNRVALLTSWNLKGKRENFLHLNERLLLKSPRERMRVLGQYFSETDRRLSQTICHRMAMGREKLGGISGRLLSLSPLSVLQRGYSITRRIPSFEILVDSGKVKEGERVEVTLHQGRLICGVEKSEKP